VLDKGKLASPTCEEASWDQLHEVTMVDLSKKGKSFAVQVWYVASLDFEFRSRSLSRGTVLQGNE